jgi:cupin 2 domain-containing protein
MTDSGGNIFTNLPDSLPAEVFQSLQQGKDFKLERIISQGHSTPAQQWYDQDQAEWVILLSGAAGLRFDGDDTVQTLRPGDFVNIPAHQRHRLEWTAPNEITIWLALHYST